MPGRPLALMVLLVGLVALADPDLLQPANLKTLGCAAPDTAYVFVRGSQPGNVYYPGDAVDLVLRVTPKAPAPAALELGITEIAMREDKYLDDGWGVMTKPVAVQNLGSRGRVKVPGKLELKPGQATEVKVAGVRVPERYGTYLVTVLPNGKDPQFLCTLVRVMKPREGFFPDAPVFGEGQFLTHDNQDPQRIRERALTLGRLGLKGVRIELGPPMAQPGSNQPYDWARYDALMNALAEAKVKALVTMGGHPAWSMPFGEPTPACIPEKPDHSCAPKDLAAFGQGIFAFCQRYWKDGEGALFAIEHWNEPWEGISISGWESDSNHYRELMKRIAENAHRVDPRIKTAAACSIMNTEDKFLVGEERNELSKLVDLFTDHYVPPRASYGPMVARFWGKQSTDTESWIAANELLLPQVMCQFLACGQDRVTPWHPQMVYYPVPGAPMTHFLPNPVALASNVFNVFITGRPFQRLLFLDHLPWAFQFGADDDAVVVLLPRLYSYWGSGQEDVLWWQFNLETGGTLTIENPDRAIECYDLAGNREFAKDRQITVPADYLAHYLKAPKGGARLIAERLRHARYEGVRPVELIARDFTTPLTAPGAAARVTLHNLLGQEVTGELTVTPPPGVTLVATKATVQLGFGARQDVSFAVAKAEPTPANAYLFKYHFQSATGQAEWQEYLHCLVVRHGTKTIDGDLADWPDDLGVVVKGTPKKADPTLQAWLPFAKFVEQAPQGSFAEVKLAWDERCLYLAARVYAPGAAAAHERLESGKWDENQYFRSAQDDAVCESLRPYRQFVTADWNNRDVAAKLKAAPEWPAYEQFLKTHPDAADAVRTNAASVYLRARDRNPQATFANATYVYKRSPGGDHPFSGDTVQFALDVIPNYFFNLKPDTDRVPFGFHAMPDTDYEYSAYACKDGGTELWRLLAPGVPRGHYYPRQPRAKYDQGPVAGGQLVVKRTQQVTVYEMAIPWAELRLDQVPWAQLGATPWTPQAGRLFAFSFKVNHHEVPTLFFGAGKSATKTNGLSFHPYWEGKPSCTVQWALSE